MKPPYAPMWPAKLHTVLTTPCRIVYGLTLLLAALLINKCERGE